MAKLKKANKKKCTHPVVGWVNRNGIVDKICTKCGTVVG